MTLETSIVISAVSVAFALYSGMVNINRNKKKDEQAEATSMATVIAKLENIGNCVNEIKADMRNVKDDVQRMRERLVAVEQSTKSAHHRIDNLIGKEEEKQ